MNAGPVVSIHQEPGIFDGENCLGMLCWKLWHIGLGEKVVYRINGSPSPCAWWADSSAVEETKDTWTHQLSKSLAAALMSAGHREGS